MNEPIVNSLNAWLLRTTVEGSILIAVVFCLIFTLGRNLGPRWRVALWALVGLKLLVPASMSFLPGLGNWNFVMGSTPDTEAFVRSSDVALPVETQLEATEAPFTAAVEESSAMVNDGFSVETIIWGIWLGGAVAFLAVLFIRQHRFVNQTRGRFCRDRLLLELVAGVSRDLKLRQQVPVVLGRAGTTPAVFGAITPTLLIPADWAERFDGSELRHILLHELEHVRFGDVFWNWAAALVNALHWFNPLVWMAVSRFQADRELRCDADTIARLEAGDRVAYGRTLLNVQETFHAAPAIAGLAPCVRKTPALRQRIAMITKPTASRSWLNTVFMFALIALICFSFGSAAKADGEREGGRERDRREESREGARDGEREGDRGREGEGKRESREGARDGDREGDRSDRAGREGARDHGVRDGQLKLTVVADGVVLGDRKLSLIDLRGALEKQNATSATIYASESVPFQNVQTVVNALGNSGISKVSFASADTPGREGEMRREGSRDGEGGRTREGARDGEGEMRREGARDGERGRTREGARDGEGEMRREGARDGEGGRTREGARDGEGKMRREGARDGEGGRTREGTRDGEGEMRREGARDGEGGRIREGARDGEGDMKREGPRDGERSGSREGEREEGGASAEGMDDRQLAQLSRIFKVYDKDDSKTVTFKEWVAMKNYELTRDQEKREKGWFDEADANGNEELTLGEWIDWKSSQGR